MESSVAVNKDEIAEKRFQRWVERTEAVIQVSMRKYTTKQVLFK
jgi:hypothetical protein